METIHNSKHILIEYDEANALFIFKFTDLAAISEGDFKQELETQASLSEKYHPMRFLFHSKNFDYAISPDFQQWIDDNIFPRYIAAGVKKFAYIMSADMISQLSIEQTMEEKKAAAFETRFFENEEEAMEWLLS